MNLETGAASAQGAYDAGLSSRRNRKRGDQGVDALHYTERTRTASNDPRSSYQFDAARLSAVSSQLSVSDVGRTQSSGAASCFNCCLLLFSTFGPRSIRIIGLGGDKLNIVASSQSVKVLNEIFDIFFT